MNARFADTSYIVALANPVDDLHPGAVELAAGFHGRIVTTEYVLLEVANFFCRANDRQLFVEQLRQLKTDRFTTIVPSSHSLWERGADLFTRRADKNWSLTGCISFVIMEEHGLTEALTADHHFEQAGFAVLLTRPVK